MVETTGLDEQGSEVTRITIRAVKPTDRPNLTELLQGLSFGSRYFRFGNGAIEFNSEDIEQFCNPDPTSFNHYIALANLGDREQIVGSAIVDFGKDIDSSEISLLVADAWKGAHIAHQLLNYASSEAFKQGTRELRLHVLPTNRRMQRFALGHGFTLLSGKRASEIKTYSLTLNDGPSNTLL